MGGGGSLLLCLGGTSYRKSALQTGLTCGLSSFQLLGALRYRIITGGAAALVLLLQLLYKREEEYRKNPAFRPLRFNSALLLPSSGDIVKKATNT